jgi:hypothetical protein
MKPITPPDAAAATKSADFVLCHRAVDYINDILAKNFVFGDKVLVSMSPYPPRIYMKLATMYQQAGWMVKVSNPWWCMGSSVMTFTASPDLLELPG